MATETLAVELSEDDLYRRFIETVTAKAGGGASKKEVTIRAHGAFPARRVPVGFGLSETP